MSTGQSARSIIHRNYDVLSAVAIGHVIESPLVVSGIFPFWYKFGAKFVRCRHQPDCTWAST